MSRKVDAGAQRPPGLERLTEEQWKRVCALKSRYEAEGGSQSLFGEAIRIVLEAELERT